MRTLDVERLAAGDYALIKPLLIELHLGEQVHYSDHPQLPREEIERHLAQIPEAFRGENVIYAARDEGGAVVGFCWLVLYDPGTGLEGEVPELFVSEDHRGKGIGEMLVQQATRFFAETRVTLAYVWTRTANAAAVRLYRSAGFQPDRPPLTARDPPHPPAHGRAGATHQIFHW